MMKIKRDCISSQLWWDTLTTGCWIRRADIVWGMNAMIQWHPEPCLLVISGKYTFVRPLTWQEQIGDRDTRGEERSKYLLSNSWQCRIYLVVASLSLNYGYQFALSTKLISVHYDILTRLINTALSPVVFKPKKNSYMLDDDFSLIFGGDSKASEVRHPRDRNCMSLGMCSFAGWVGGVGVGGVVTVEIEPCIKYWSTSLRSLKVVLYLQRCLALKRCSASS